MKVIIAGSRNFTNYQKLEKECDQFFQEQKNIEIVSGGHYKGADKLGEQYVKEKELKLKRFPAEWNIYGKAAGPKRNKEMAIYADALIVFWDGKSRGTKNMIQHAKQNGLIVKVVLF
jgi:glycerophosphoryl diester phosphodiesterase